uniref:Uncharacterized protein n=1 Tax=Aegilops tauschii subsp. strangulata TaxID=200361 RepID=A0A453DMU7_AEGTS
MLYPAGVYVESTLRVWVMSRWRGARGFTDFSLGPATGTSLGDLQGCTESRRSSTTGLWLLSLLRQRLPHRRAHAHSAVPHQQHRGGAVKGARRRSKE